MKSFKGNKKFVKHEATVIILTGAHAREKKNVLSLTQVHRPNLYWATFLFLQYRFCLITIFECMILFCEVYNNFWKIIYSKCRRAMCTWLTMLHRLRVWLNNSIRYIKANKRFFNFYFLFFFTTTFFSIPHRWKYITYFSASIQFN